MEYIIVKHIANHVDKYRILTRTNTGSVRLDHVKLSSSQQYMTLLGYECAVRRGSLDFSKAFDTVPHNRLLWKLHHYGTDGNIHHWLAFIFPKEP